MHSSLLRFALAAFAIKLCTAQTPPSFDPATSNHLTVTYGTSAINPAGITVPVTEVAQPPSLGFPGTHIGAYVVVMMDLSVEANGPTAPNTTLIHWILPGLSSPNGTTALSSHQNAIAPYFPPGPPAGQTHTYALFLYEEPADFNVPQDFVPIFANLTASVYNRVGFNLTKFVDETHLGRPIAADWCLVSNTSSTNTSSGASATTSSTIATVSPSSSTITSSGASATTSSTIATASPSSSLGSVGFQVDMLVEMAIGAAALLLTLL